MEYRVLDEAEWAAGSELGSDQGGLGFIPTQSLSSLLAGLPALGSHFDPEFEFGIGDLAVGVSGEGGGQGTWEVASEVDHVAATGQLKTCSEEGDCTVSAMEGVTV